MNDKACHVGTKVIYGKLFFITGVVTGLLGQPIDKRSCSSCKGISAGVCVGSLAAENNRCVGVLVFRSRRADAGFVCFGFMAELLRGSPVYNSWLLVLLV